jgi:hypothetical protein
MNMLKTSKNIVAAIASVFLAVSAPLSAAASITPEVVDNGLTSGSTTFTGTFTNVTTTLGASGAYYSNGTSPIFFSTDASGANYSGSWVKWSFSKPVTKVRVYYAHVESVLYSNNSGDNDPQSWKTNRGNVNLALIANGGNREASAGDVVEDQPEASLSGNVADCVAPNVACSGYIDLSFPEGISWIQTQNAAGGAGPGFNGVGLALDAGELGAPSVPLANTGFDFRFVGFAASMMILGAFLAKNRQRGRHRA